MLPFVVVVYRRSLKLLVLFFDEYVEYFPNLSKGGNIRFLSINKFQARIGMGLFFSVFPKVLRLLRRSIPLKERALDSIISKKTSFVYGWDYRNIDLGEYLDSETKERVLDLFKPSDDVSEVLDSFFAGLRSSVDVVVGVHVRRGDYKDFQNGRFFFESEVYDLQMRNIERELNELGKSVCFVLCSNEIISTANFSCQQVCHIPESSEILDLYGLARCDFIIGVPSTYSQWASFYGSVPISFIIDLETRLELKDFKLILSLDKFEDGTATYVL